MGDISKGKRVTKPAKKVTSQSDILARARPSFGGDVTLSPVTQRVTQEGDIKTGDSDIPGCRRSRHHHPESGEFSLQPQSWMHIAAMNLIHDHEAGKKVDAGKLAASYKLLGRAPARLPTEVL